MTKNKLFSRFVCGIDCCVEFDILPVILLLALSDFLKIRFWFQKEKNHAQYNSNATLPIFFEKYLVRNIEWLERSRHRKCSVKKMFLNFANCTGKHLCYSLFLIKLQVFRPATYEKEIPTKVFSCEICETFKNPYSEEQLRTTASNSTAHSQIFNFRLLKRLCD